MKWACHITKDLYVTTYHAFCHIFRALLGTSARELCHRTHTRRGKSAALDELSQSIEVSVRAKHSIIQAQSQEQSYEEVISHITLESSSQFIQPKITYKKLKKNLYEAAILIDDPAPYHAALKKLSAEIDALSIGVETPITQRDLKERIYKLENIIGLYKTYRAYELVLLAMGEPIRSAPKQNLAYFAAKYSSIDPEDVSSGAQILALLKLLQKTLLQAEATIIAEATILAKHSLKRLGQAIAMACIPH